MPDVESTSKISLDISDLLANLDAMKRAITRANATFKQETAGMDDWSKDADGLSAKLKNLDTVLKEQKRIIENYNQQIQAHSRKQKDAQEEVEKHRQELQKLKEQGLDETTKAYKAEQAELEKAIKAERAEGEAIETLKTKIEKQQASVAVTEKAIQKWTKAQEDLVKESSSLETVVKTQERELRDLKKEYVNVATSEGETSDSAKELEKKISELSEELVKNKKALSDAEKAADGFDHSLDGIGNQAAETTEQVQEQGGIFNRSLDNFVGGVMLQAATAVWDGIKKAISSTIDFMKDAVLEGAEYADSILTLASTTGIGTDALQEYAYMEELVDVSTGTIAKSMKKLKSQISSAAKGNKTATEAFEKLDISIYDTNGELRDSEDIFTDALDALSGIENETERDAAAMDLFGRSASDLNPLIEAGSDELERLKKEAHDSGAVLSGPALRSLGAAKNGMDKLSKSVETTKNRISQNFAPALEKATGTLNDALNNPRTQLAIDNLTSGIGDMLNKGAELITNVLPDILGFFSGDVHIKAYTDAELEMYNGLVNAKKAHEDLRAEYNDNSQDILNEQERLQKIWAELQTITDDSGKVKAADHERAQVLINELNGALEKEWTLNGNLIEDYQTMQKEINNLIKKKSALALIDAGADQYAQNVTGLEAQRQNAAIYYQAMVKASKDVWQAQKAYNAALEEYDKLRITNAAGVKEDTIQSLAYLTTLGKIQSQYETAKEKAASTRAEYESSQAEYIKMEEEIDRYERAQAAAVSENYTQVIDIMANETGATLEFYARKKELAEQDRKELKKIRDQQILDIAEYQRGLAAGSKKHNEQELEKMKKQLELTNALLEGNMEEVRRLSKELGEAYDDGLADGIKLNRDKVVRAARETSRQALQATRDVLEIASPSKVMRRYGEYMDEGLAEGMKAQLRTVERASAQMAQAAIPGQQNGSASGSGAAAAAGPSFVQNIYAPKTPSRLELYRDTQNLLAMEGLA